MATRPTFEDSLKQLIAAQSVSSTDPRHDQSNQEVSALLANWFEALGFSVEMQVVSQDPDKINVIAVAGEGEGGLVLSGHTDTVPFDQDLWEQDPFTLTEKNDRLYGLGVSDMKCFFSIILDVVAELDLKQLKQPLTILATCDEECTMAGARALMDSGRTLGRYAVIGEPTGLKPVHLHKGIVMESIKLTGRAGHSSNPALGVNAMEGMHGVITDLMTWRKQWQAQHPDNAFAVPVPTLNFGSIHGGDNPNRICAECELTIDMRILPGMDLQDARAQFRQVVMQSIDGKDLKVNFEALVDGTPPLQTPIEAEIIRIAEKLSGERSGSVAFGTEGPFFNEMGMDTVIIGAGDIEVAHQANEYLSLDRIDPMKTMLHGFIRHFCMTDNEHVS